jgi:quercetin dioxygenase-like cupin family protein
MPLDLRRLDVRRFHPDKLQKLNLFETTQFFCDVYCLEPGQAQAPHAHAGSDKIYAVLEGRVVASVGADSSELAAGDAVLAPAGSVHGVSNPGPARAAVLVFMAPHPAPKPA